MAAAASSMDKVKDKEYSNWLKVTLALYYMKSGLHTFIQSEIDQLHQSLVQKIYGGQTVLLPPCTLCDASHVKRNKFTGVWAFQKRCRSYCDVWLHELLILHNNPKSEKIYWDNSDISACPFKSWECAKVFMPRGQPSINDGPVECDTQALLTLLSNCRHFHGKLSPQGLSLTHTVSVVRNKVMHDGEMKVSDGDTKNYLQQMIQLLEDHVHLKSLEDCKDAVGNINKINNDSMDVFFNVELQMMALKTAVNEVRQELGVHGKTTLDTIGCLEEEYKQLTTKLEDVETRMDTVESDVKIISASVATYGERVDAVEETLSKLQDNRQRTEPTEISTTSFANEEDPATATNTSPVLAMVTAAPVSEAVMDVLQANSVRAGQFLLVSVPVQQGRKTIRKEYGAVVLQVQEDDLEVRYLCQKDGKYHFPDIEDDAWIVHADIVGHLYMAQMAKTPIKRRAERDCQRRIKKTYKKRRLESDGLWQLKSQTEDRLDTIRRLECIPTTQAAKAKKLLEEKWSVVIKGNPGDGKTTTALHLIDDEMYRCKRVVVEHPREWKTVVTDRVGIVVLEDIFGRYDLDHGRLQEWMTYLPTIQEHVDARKLRVIITTRVDIFPKASSRLEAIHLFSEDWSVTLSSKQLKDAEKISILNRELKRHERNMNEDGQNNCIANFSGFIGFPHCCSLFAGDINLFAKGPEFFKFPKKLFVVNIANLEAVRFLSLAFLFCHGEIWEEDLSPETMQESSKRLLMELASCLHVSEKVSITSLREAYDNFSELYVAKCKSVEKAYIWFCHTTVCEAVGQILGERCLEMVVKYGDSDYLYQRTYTAETKDSTSQNVFIPVCLYGVLAERMVHDITDKGLVGGIFSHSALKQHQFLVKLKHELDKSNRIRDFFLVNQFSKSTYFWQDLSQGQCITFLQYILQSDEDAVKLVYNQFLEYLECTHNKISSGCWKCKEKQKLLELALYFKHFYIADKLIAMNACYTYVSLCNAVRHGDLRRVQTIQESLKRSKLFSREHTVAKKILCRAYVSGNQDVIEFLLNEGITLDSSHIVHVVQQGDIEALKKVVEHLKCHNNWKPNIEQQWTHMHYFLECLYLCSQDTRLHEIVLFPFSLALFRAFSSEKLDMADYLLKNNVKVSMYLLKFLLGHSSHQNVAKVVKILKDTGTWSYICDDALKALEDAYIANDNHLCSLLAKIGISLTMKNLPAVVKGLQVSFRPIISSYSVSSEAVKNAIQELKDTDSWDPKCDDASEALTAAYNKQMYDVCDLLVQEGVSLTMKNLPFVILRSLDDVKKAVQQLKDTDGWDPRCYDASKALEKACGEQKYDVCVLLIHEGVSLRAKNLHVLIIQGSLELLKKAIQQLKDTDDWAPKCGDTSLVLENAIIQQKFDMCDLLIMEGVSITMKNIPVIGRFGVSLESIWKAIKHLKDTNKWDRKCNDASTALKEACIHQKYDVCDLLVGEGVSLAAMKDLHVVIFKVSLDYAKKMIQHMKHTDRWDPNCYDASKTLAIAYREQKYDIWDLLIQEGVPLTMKNFPDMIHIKGFRVSLQSVKKVIHHLKNTYSWDPLCCDASKALAIAYREERYDLWDLLILEGVPLMMKNFPDMVHIKGFRLSLDCLKKTIQHLKNTYSWNPKCHDASKALAVAYRSQQNDVCDLLVQEGVSLTMKNLLDIIGFVVSLGSVKKAIQHLKDTEIWNPKCDDASKALEKAYREQRSLVCDLLIQEGISLTMKNLPGLLFWGSLESARKAIQHLKDTNQWNPSSDYAVNSLAKIKSWGKKDIYDQLIKNGVCAPKLDK